MQVSMTELKAALNINIEADIPTMIWGAPGIGKSDAVRQVAKERGIGLIDFRATLRDPVDMRGLPMIDAKTGTSRWLPPAELPNEKRDGKEGILFMDELPQASQAMQAACFGLVLDRYIGEYHLPKGWIPIAAGNRMIDRAGAQRMPTALRNRFAHFEVNPELEAWCAWAATANINPLVLAFARYRPGLLHRMPEGDDNAFPTPRAWEKVSKIADQKNEHLRMTLVAALVGDAAGVEFEGFVRMWSRLPDINQIFLDPRYADVPGMDEPGVLYAVAAAIARRVTPKTLVNMITYCRRLPKEFEVFSIQDAARRDPALKSTKAFGDWYAANAEVMI